MPLRISNLLPLLPLLALTLACGGGSSTQSTPHQTPRRTEAPAPIPVLNAAPQPLAFEAKAITCAPGDPILLMPVRGGLGDQATAPWIDLEARVEGTGAVLGGCSKNLGRPMQSLFYIRDVPQAPGVTTLQVRAKVGEAWTAPTRLSLTIEPASAVQAGLRITPSAATVVPGGRVIFKGVLPRGQDQDEPGLAFGTETAGAGTLSRVGKALFLYQAPAEPGTYKVVVTRIADGSRAQAVITVAQPAS
ncbi:MAG TPA: hypothetical protein VK188_17110 [Holophaga sp.]|nr:hypothetical protein [Holophaga sp.]